MLCRQVILEIEDYTEAIRLDPESVSNYNMRGLAYCEQCQYDLGIEDFTEAIRLDPANYSNRGSAYKKKGEHDLAAKDSVEFDKLKNFSVNCGGHG